MSMAHQTEPSSKHKSVAALSDPADAADGFPPLQSLRAFEASARHKSFARAAKELSITPSAVTHHIRIVEKWVGSALFRRVGRRIELTPRAGAALLSLREGFSRIQAGARILKEPERRGLSVAVSIAPSFASKWLLPRLNRFRDAHPDVEVYVSADNACVDFGKSDVDLAIRYGAGNYHGLVAERLKGESVFPVASPDLIKRFGPFEHPKDVLNAPLLHDASPDNDPSCPDWFMWLRARGVESPEAQSGSRYNQSSLVLEAALAGKGIALAKRVIAAEDLLAGRVRPLFSEGTPLSSAYWLVWPEGRVLEPAAALFAAWLRNEIENTGDQA
ncbi:MAG: LysR substrate-binding domain-containing protein [Caulobacterales bacterium]